MRILSIDEIPVDWKDVITEHGIARYRVLSDDIQANIAIQGQSVQKIISILSGKENSVFPYSDLRVSKPKEKNLRSLNKRNHMGVLVQDEDSENIQFIQGRLQMNTAIDCSDIGTELTL